MKKTTSPSRREFLAVLSSTPAWQPSLGLSAPRQQVTTVQDVIDLLKGMASRTPPSSTVDTVKTGNPNQPLRGIVTTFIPSCRVIERAIQIGANLIVTHEPTYYTHEDEVDWLEEDPVYLYKRRLAEDNGIVIWRFHDYQHRIDPDPVMQAAVGKLGWGGYRTADSRIFEIPRQTVREVAEHAKRTLGASTVRVVGDPELPCRRAGILLGSPGSRWAIRFLGQNPVDVSIAGEVSSWEAAEYMRDAIHSGQRTAMIVAGHAATEEPGMEMLAETLKEQLSGFPVEHVPAGGPYWFL